MGKMKKIKKWTRQGAKSAERAERAAVQAERDRRQASRELQQAQRHRQRIEELLDAQQSSEPSLGQVGSGRAPIYTAPAGSAATAPIGEVTGRAKSARH
jgi:acetyl-CoA carboxylase carboxyltransferase component